MISQVENQPGQVSDFLQQCGSCVIIPFVHKVCGGCTEDWTEAFSGFGVFNWFQQCYNFGFFSYLRLVKDVAQLLNSCRTHILVFFSKFAIISDKILSMPEAFPCFK